MTKNVNMSTGKFILFMMAFILIGAGVVGLPLLYQSMNLYDENARLEEQVSESMTKVSRLEYERAGLINDFNTTMSERNTLLLAIELAEGDQVNWEAGLCKNTLTGLAQDC